MQTRSLWIAALLAALCVSTATAQNAVTTEVIVVPTTLETVDVSTLAECVDVEVMECQAPSSLLVRLLDQVQVVVNGDKLVIREVPKALLTRFDEITTPGGLKLALLVNDEEIAFNEGAGAIVKSLASAIHWTAAEATCPCECEKCCACCPVMKGKAKAEAGQPKNLKFSIVETEPGRRSTAVEVRPKSATPPARAPRAVHVQPKTPKAPKAPKPPRAPENAPKPEPRRMTLGMAGEPSQPKSVVVDRQWRAVAEAETKKAGEAQKQIEHERKALERLSEHHRGAAERHHVEAARARELKAVAEHQRQEAQRAREHHEKNATERAVHQRIREVSREIEVLKQMMAEMQKRLAELNR